MPNPANEPRKFEEDEVGRQVNYDGIPSSADQRDTSNQERAQKSSPKSPRESARPDSGRKLENPIQEEVKP